VPADLFDRITVMLAEGNREHALRAFMLEAVGVPEDMVAAMAKAPMWAQLSRHAGSLPHDGALLAGLQAGKPLPQGRWRSCTARVLVIDGEQSPPFLRNAAAALVALVPTSRRHTLTGQDHSAAFTAPQTLVPPIRDFCLERSPTGAPATRGP
jgi:pimeloyl-ACP methyl ester carboxylesterase